MTRHIQLRLFVLLLCSTAATVLVAGENERCPATANECERQIRQILVGKRYLGLHVIEVAGLGLTIKSVVPGSPAEKAGFTEGDRIIAVNERWTTDATPVIFKQMIADTREDGRIRILILRGGVHRRIEARMSPYSKTQIDKIVASHMARSHSATASNAP